MATNVKASYSFTVTYMIDILAVVRYYKLQSSVLNPPTKPTDNQDIPSGWTETEPSYTEGSTNTLYFVDKTVLSNGGIKYSMVSVSSSYEAAKSAYNKAVAAANAAEDAKTQATNFIGSIPAYGSGLTIGDLSGDTLGKNTYIDQDGVAIRDGVDELARFGETIELTPRKTDPLVTRHIKIGEEIDFLVGKSSTEDSNLSVSRLQMKLDSNKLGHIRGAAETIEFLGESQVSAISQSQIYMDAPNVEIYTNDAYINGYRIPIIQHGRIQITPKANTPSYVSITFPRSFPSGAEPSVTVTAISTVPGSTVQEVSVSAVDRESFLLYIYRTTAVSTGVYWQAIY